MLSATTKNDLNIPGLIWTDPERMSGAPCFYGTRAVSYTHLTLPTNREV